MKVRLLTVSSTTANEKEIPQIRLQGQWLDKIGFSNGKKFIVEERKGELVLKTVTIEN